MRFRFFCSSDGEELRELRDSNVRLAEENVWLREELKTWMGAHARSAAVIQQLRGQFGRRGGRGDRERIEDVMDRQTFYLESLRSLVDRALTYGRDDWTVDFEKRAVALLNDLHDAIGSLGDCEACPAKRVFVRLVTEPGTDDSTVRVCATCRQDPPLRRVA